jgi:Ca2+/Na+ antiporter
MEEQRRIVRVLESVRITSFRLWGVGAILISSFGMLMSVLTLVTAMMLPASERMTRLGEGIFFVLVCALFMYLGIRAVRVSRQELRDAPAQLAQRRDQFETWVNKSSGREDV